MNIIDIPQFIKEYITKREESLFAADLHQYHSELSEAIQDKSVLVIGGAGTIGSSFIKAILHHKPRKLCVVDTNENGLTELTRQLRSIEGQYVPVDYKTYPMNFADAVFKKMFIAEGPFHIVANFAAHKHVRSEKDRYSIEAMLENNVFNAQSLLELLGAYPPEHFFCVSTDKAANPVNIMGASKKLMEETIMAYSGQFKISTARFANVAFSNGSLLDGYIYRLMNKQPLSCPADVKRFFVSPEESGQICLLACVLGQSGEIFFPKLADDKLISFKDITLQFIHESGKKPAIMPDEATAKSYLNKHETADAYPIYFFDTNTSGEKLYEEFYTEEDEVDMNTFQGMGIIKNAKKCTPDTIQNVISGLKTLLASNQYNKNDIVMHLSQCIPNFEHIETGKNLDEKM